MVFNSNSRLPQVVPRTPKGARAADANSVFMNLLESGQVLKTGLSSAGARVLACTDGGRKQRQRQNMRSLRSLTFELSGRRRQDARPGLAKMYRVPPDRAWWPAVGAPLERGVRRRRAQLAAWLQRELRRQEAQGRLGFDTLQRPFLGRAGLPPDWRLAANARVMRVEPFRSR